MFLFGTWFWFESLKSKRFGLGFNAAFGIVVVQAIVYTGLVTIPSMQVSIEDAHVGAAVAAVTAFVMVIVAEYV